jgi:hypothetical protein
MAVRLDKNTPDFFVAWEHQAKPPTATVELIGKGGEYLTGASSTELKQELAACVAEALKKESGELANREFRGVKIECQAVTRDGGGGSATIYRRFGAYPVRPALTEKERAAMLRAAKTHKAEEDAQAAASTQALDPAAMVAFVAMAEKASVFCDGAVFNQAKASKALAAAGAVLGVNKRDKLSSKYNQAMIEEILNNRMLFCANARELAHSKNLEFFTFEDN